MLLTAFKTMAYKLAQSSQEERTDALRKLARLDGAKIKMIIAAMCEVYVNLDSEKINKTEAKRLMDLIEKDLDEVLKNV